MPRGLEMTTHPELRLVYGEAGEDLIFLPQERALDLARIQYALFANTWGEFIEMLPADTWREMEQALHEEFGPNHFQEYCEHLSKKRLAMPVAEAMDRYRQLCPGTERPVLPEDPFDRMFIRDCADGDWPPWPAREMLKYVPKTVQMKYGHIQESVLNGPFLKLDSKRKPDIIRELRDAGYRVERHDGLIRIVSGYGSQCSEEDWQEVAALISRPKLAVFRRFLENRPRCNETKTSTRNRMAH
jgi:hypothetical protein